jgi:hypothetical protein
MLRYSLAGLLLLVLLIAVALAAFVNASPTWATLVVSTTVGVLMMATVAAFSTPAKTRRFAAGFAACGWMYLVLVLGPWPDEFKALLFTEQAVDRLAASMGDEAAESETPPKGMILPDGRDFKWLVRYRPSMQRHIGRSIAALLVGGLGGALASLLAGKREVQQKGF